jgi:hypothetical protein
VVGQHDNGQKRVKTCSKLYILPLHLSSAMYFSETTYIQNKIVKSGSFRHGHTTERNRRSGLSLVNVCRAEIDLNWSQIRGLKYFLSIFLKGRMKNLPILFFTGEPQTALKGIVSRD